MHPWRHLRDYRSSIALESDIALAGSAMACPFSSSDEFEAAVIEQRRATGMYHGATWWPVLAGMVIVVSALVALS
jgi:hypothetical protein